jgi:hypothetical protein
LNRETACWKIFEEPESKTGLLQQVRLTALLHLEAGFSLEAILEVRVGDILSIIIASGQRKDQYHRLKNSKELFDKSEQVSYDRHRNLPGKHTTMPETQDFVESL